jgi:pimeloyl-ACP methyl ester carboxylesterase
MEVDGARIHYQEFGDAANQPIFLIHGYTASTYVWKTVAPMLSEGGFRVIALDLLGFGFSEKPKWFDYSVQAQSRIISHFMDRLGIGSPAVVGNSYGGAVAMMLALDHPEKVGKLILVDPVTNDDPKNHPVLRMVAFRGIGEILTPFMVDSRLLVRSRMRKTIARANHHLVTDERIEAIQRPLRAADCHHSLLATSRNWNAARIEQDAHLIDQPTLIIWGEQHAVIPIKHGYKLHSKMPKSRLVVLKDYGHVPPEEKSEIFARLVSEFCTGDQSNLGLPAH